MQFVTILKAQRVSVNETNKSPSKLQQVSPLITLFSPSKKSNIHCEKRWNYSTGPSQDWLRLRSGYDRPDRWGAHQVLGGVHPSITLRHKGLLESVPAHTGQDLDSSLVHHWTHHGMSTIILWRLKTHSLYFTYFFIFLFFLFLWLISSLKCATKLIKLDMIPYNHVRLPHRIPQ